MSDKDMKNTLLAYVSKFVAFTKVDFRMDAKLKNANPTQLSRCVIELENEGYLLRISDENGTPNDYIVRLTQLGLSKLDFLEFADLKKSDNSLPKYPDPTANTIKENNLLEGNPSISSSHPKNKTSNKLIKYIKKNHIPLGIILTSWITFFIAFFFTREEVLILLKKWFSYISD